MATTETKNSKIDIHDHQVKAAAEAAPGTVATSDATAALSTHKSFH